MEVRIDNDDRQYDKLEADKPVQLRPVVPPPLSESPNTIQETDEEQRGINIFMKLLTTEFRTKLWAKLKQQALAAAKEGTT